MTNIEYALNKVRNDSREVESSEISSALLNGVYNRFFNESELHKIGSYEGNIVLKLSEKVLGQEAVVWQIQEALANM